MCIRPEPANSGRTSVRVLLFGLKKPSATPFLAFGTTPTAMSAGDGPENGVSTAMRGPSGVLPQS